MAPYSPDIVVAVVDCGGEALPPAICLSCLTYINQYSKLLDNNRWECPLCGSDENVLDDKLIQQGGLLSAALSTSIVEYHQKFQHAQPLGATISTCTYIILLDANLSRREANAVGEAIQFACRPKPGENYEVKIGLIVFDRTVAMYQLGLSGMAAADVCTIQQATSDDHLANRKSQILQRPYLATIRPDGDDDMSYLWRCISAVFGTTVGGDSSLAVDFPEEAPKVVSRLEMLKQRKEARQRQQALVDGTISGAPRESPWARAHAKKSTLHPSRCTGEALQCAIDLATISQSKTNTRSQILLFTNGCPNIGDGSVVIPEMDRSSKRKTPSRTKPADVIKPARLSSAVQYFEKLAAVAQEHEVGIDVFCTGAHELAMPVFQAVVEPSGGYVIPHETFETPHLKYNMEFLLSETYISKSKATNSDPTIAVTSNHHTSTHLEGCMVDMRMSA